MVHAFAAHTVAHAVRDGTALIAVAEEMAVIGALRFGMEAAVHAAEAFLATGHQDSARRAASRARELHQPGQGGSAPEIDGLDEATVGLTAREAQLVDLVARGMTNAEIAERLVLSVRTVESHVYRAMHKLGVSDRRELRRDG
jgi:DNA-binding NarL/FixJ family response regulator